MLGKTVYSLAGRRTSLARNGKRVGMAIMTETRLRLRPMSNDDIPAVRAMSAAEQWPHRAEDLTAMLALGNGVVAVIDDEVVASTMWWTCGAVATLGMVLVARTHRGAGLGRQVMDAVLSEIGDRSVLLNATDAGLPLYHKLGFQTVGEIYQQQGTTFTAPLIPLDKGERIRPVGASDETRIAAMDAAATGLERRELIRWLLANGHGIVLDREGEVTGFALFRRFGRGYVIGPVVAPDATRARALIAQWIGSRSGEFIRVDITAESGLSDWLEKLGIIRVGRGTTMVRGTVPAPSVSARSFAIASQALC
jgi:predicted N-acetyltransferase YhbS